MISLEEFQNLTVEEVAKIVRADRGNAPKTCVFPFNGTRRWFLLEYGREAEENLASKYLEMLSHAYIEVYRLVFDHGIANIVAPVFGGEILNRGEQYMREVGAGMSLLATHPAFLEFYKQYGVRVHFYGDYRKRLQSTPYEYLCGQFDEITRQTAHHAERCLFYGVFGEDATLTVVELAVKYYQTAGRLPTRRELIEQYYGEYVEKADIFIGFEKFNVFDYPMLGWGEESLYYTVVPSLYMNQRLLRKILHDYVYLRPVQDPDYSTMPHEDFDEMRRFYEINREAVFGAGEMRGGIWYSKSGARE